MKQKKLVILNSCIKKQKKKTTFKGVNVFIPHQPLTV